MQKVQRTLPKVLLVGPKLPTGGIARFVESILGANIDAELYLFNVARPAKERIYFRVSGYLELLNGGLKRALIGILITLRHLIIFPTVLLRNHTKIVHLAGTSWLPFWEFISYGLISKLMKKKVIFHYLGPFEDFYRRSSSLPRFFIPRILRKFDAIIVESHLNEDVLSRFIPRERLFVIPNGVKIPLGKARIRLESNSPIRVLFLGGADPMRKGLLDVIKSMPLVVEDGVRVEWVIGGTQTAHALIQKNCPPNAIDSIRFVGLLSESEKTNLFQSCDVFALPSYEEGMPYAILEAMSYGLTIISTKIGSIPEVVKECENGFLIEPGDYKGFATCILRLCKNPALFSEIAQRNRAIIAEKYSEDKEFSQISRLYYSLS